jgi:hypothetical protein
MIKKDRLQIFGFIPTGFSRTHPTPLPLSMVYNNTIYSQNLV